VEFGELVADVVDPGGVFASEEVPFGDEERDLDGSPGACPFLAGKGGFGTVDRLGGGFEVYPRFGEAESQGRPSLDGIGAEDATQLREQRVEAAVDRRRVGFVPEGFSELVTGHVAVAVHDEVREKQSPLPTGQLGVDAPAVVFDNEAPADLDPEWQGGARQGHTNIMALRSTCGHEGGLMAKLIRCECGFIARGETDDQVIEVIRGHMATDHPALLDTVSRQDLLGWIQAE
jgi:predicted small metal-binding protein